MMSSRPRLLATLLVLAWAGVPLRAYGDPVRITSGFLEVPGLGRSATFHFVGNDFEASGIIEPGVVGPELTCVPCETGVRIDLGATYSGLFGIGTATVDGSAFEGNFGGSLFFSAPTIVAPVTAEDFTVMDSFALTGHLVGLLNFNTPDEVVAFDKPLTGRGVLTASFLNIPNAGGASLFAFDSVRYDFSTAGAVPEPSTLLLFGTGLSAALRWRKRRAD
jgi:hypothetical protein